MSRKCADQASADKRCEADLNDQKMIDRTVNSAEIELDDDQFSDQDDGDDEYCIGNAGEITISHLRQYQP